MKNHLYLVLFIVLQFFVSALFSQNNKVDSLIAIMNSDKADTGTVNAIQSLSLVVYKSDLDSAVKLGTKALNKALKINWQKGAGFSNHLLGVFNYMKGDLSTSLQHSQTALTIWEKLRKSTDVKLANYGKLYIAKTSVNAANVYIDQANFSKALEYDFDALKVAEELGDKKLQGINSGNIANIYLLQQDLDKALEWYTKALKLGNVEEDPWFVMNQQGNLASVYLQKKDTAKAMEYHQINLDLARKTGIKDVEAKSLSNIGLNYLAKKNYTEALKYFSEALMIAEEVGDNRAMMALNCHLGNAYRLQGKYKEAEKCLLVSLSLSEKVQSMSILRDIEDNLGNLYEKMGKPALALEHYKNYVIVRDSINKEESKKALYKSELNYEFEKKALEAKAEQDKKDAMAEADKRKQQLILWFVVFAGILILVFSLFIYNRFKVTQKQKVLIEEQKQMVEEHQREIIDSINYAKRLQIAILPPIDFVNQNAEENFIYYKPKDIVAGDFYWAERVITNEHDLFFIAAADSTGHGVPGAMVSVICSNALNRVVKEFKIFDTGKILDKTKELVIETFEKSASEVKDGMDISLLCIDRKNEKVFWSGANNPLWYITRSSSGDSGFNATGAFPDLIEIKADKQPIGKTDDPKPFTTHQIEYRKGAMFYLFTDGFADQFGGPLGKKFKYKPFGELLLANSSKPCNQQRDELKKVFVDWKGKLEQVDDVCVIGIRL